METDGEEVEEEEVEEEGKHLAAGAQTSGVGLEGGAKSAWMEETEPPGRRRILW